MHTEGHDMGKPEGVPAHPHVKRDAEHPGYETQDVNVGGTVVFIAGLAGSILVFFVFCFFMGKGINYALNKEDGPTRTQFDLSQPGVKTGAPRENLASNAEMEQRQLSQMAQAFPTPRLETDDGNQDTADLHAREDLLLNFYSTSKDLPGGTVRIPVEKAMELIVQRGLPKPANAAQARTLMAGERPVQVQAPLTTGFARTGYELDTIAAREQKLEFETAEKK